MSLINDLAIEVERRDQMPSRTVSPKTNSLDQAKRPEQSRSRLKQPQKVDLLSVAFAISLTVLVAGISFLVVAPWLASTGEQRIAANEADAHLIHDADQAAERPPSVSSKRYSDIRSHSDETERSTESKPGTPVHEWVERPNAVRSISIEHDSRRTRLRITADRPTRYRIESPFSRDTEIDIIIEAAALHSTASPFDLLDTPIQSIQTHTQSGDIRLSLKLDQAVRIQSQWISQDPNAVLAIDFQNTLRDPVAAATRRNERPVTDDKVRQDSEAKALANCVCEDDDSKEKNSNSEATADPHTNDAKIAETTNTTTTMPVATPSTDQRRRSAQEVIRGKARVALQAARSHRADGKFEESDQFYRSALAIRPGYREAILGRTTLLAKLNRVPEALALIRNARNRKPNDAPFTMLHARLVAKSGDFEAAIRILEESGFRVSNAPEVFALTAAYLQRAGRHDLAIERYESVLRHHPNESKWWMGLGISLEAKKRKSEALDVYRIALQIGELPIRSSRWVGARVTALRGEG